MTARYSTHRLYHMLLAFSTILFTLNLFTHITRPPEHIQVSMLQDEVAFWENIISKHPDYIDAYYVLSDLSRASGDNDKAVELLIKARLAEEG